ncbi:MAG: tol-pal system protein YbgF [Nitrosomonadales bacterium]|nr:tol-pal system protein YbgF [Nitrosomonadales bacterium]
MLKRCAIILLASCFAASAHASLFADDDARKQIQQLEGRVLKLEELVTKLENAVNQQTKLMLDLQGQIEALKSEISKLHGQNEELAHGLQDAEKREKDFYVDLDTRLRRFESADNAAPASDNSSKAADTSDLNDPALENRAFEAAYGLFKGGNHADAVKAFQEFLNKYPGSVHVQNANYLLGNAQFALKDYKNALSTYQGLIDNFPENSKTADVLFNVARCQQELKQAAAAQKTLKQLIAKFPNSEAAAKAKKLQAISK